MNFKKVLFSKWTRWIVSLSLLTLLLFITDISLLLENIALAKLHWLTAAVFFTLFLTAFGAVKWWFLMPRSRTGPMSFVRVNFISNFVGMFIPGIVGIEAARIAGITRSSKDLAATVASVLVDRLFGLFSLGLVVAIGGVTAREIVPPLVTLGCATLLVAILAGTFLLMSHTFRRLLERLLPEKIFSQLNKLFECLDLYRNRKHLLAGSLLLSVTFQLLRVGLVVMLCKSLGIAVALTYLLIVVPVALFVQMLPISVFGIGIRESAMITLLAVAGVSTESAFALSILLMAVQIISVLPGGIWMAMGQRLNIPEQP